MEKAITIDDLIPSGTYVSDLMSRKTLGFFSRLLLKKAVWYAFMSMKHDSPEHLERYKKFFYSDSFPKDREGWRIFRNIYEKNFK